MQGANERVGDGEVEPMVREGLTTECTARPHGRGVCLPMQAVEHEQQLDRRAAGPHRAVEQETVATWLPCIRAILAQSVV